jgi:hypothetical protein
LRRHLLNLLALLSLLLALAVVLLWRRSRIGPVAIRIPGCELLAAYNEFYVWSGERTLVVRLHFTSLLLILLTAPAIRVGTMLGTYARLQRRRNHPDISN